MSLITTEQVLETILELEGPAQIREIAKKSNLSVKVTLRLLKEFTAKKWVQQIRKDGSVHFAITPNGRYQLGQTCKGVTLGKRYVLENLVGKGNYGEVWKTTDKRMARTVAVKLLRGGMKDLGQLRAEGRALSELTHKNIVIVYDLGSDEKNGWLVTEYVDGPSLQKYLVNLVREGKWCSFDEAREIIEHVLGALEYAHDKNWVHGDVKPANILMPKTGEIKLGDFGVAKILHRTSKEAIQYPPGHVRRLGSPTYTAPEILKGRPRDFQSDLFSVGILAYVLLTGHHPFKHSSDLVDVEELIGSETFVPVKPSDLRQDIPKKYEKIVMRLLEKDQTKRYQKARKVLDEWRKRETVQCPRCSTENPVVNRFCGQCGNDLTAIGEAVSEPERDIRTSFSLFTAGRTQEAIVFMRQSLEKDPNFAQGWSHLGYMLNSERMYEESIDACTRSIELDPEQSRGYQTRGFAKSNLGKPDEAIKDFTLALDRESDERRMASILYQRGYAYRLASKFEEAWGDATTAVKLDPTNEKARILIERLKPFVKPRE